MPTIPKTSAVRSHSSKYGLMTVLAGLVLLLGLRLWASPIARRITGNENGLVEFLLIPAILLVITAGIVLFLWEPETGR